MPSGEISFPGCPAPSLHETFFRKSFRHVNNDSDVGGFSIHLLSESSIHMPGILIQNLSERPIHIARNPHLRLRSEDAGEFAAYTAEERAAEDADQQQAAEQSHHFIAFPALACPVDVLQI
jgi:hypothetical protein